MADAVEKTFDIWALNGRAEKMQKEHGKSVVSFLKNVQFDKPFTFLDVGCGNGWVVRMIAEMKLCKNAIGIDKSGIMIERAQKQSQNKKESFIHTDIEHLSDNRNFDYVFAMESMYYVDSVPTALEKIHSVLNPGGMFFCGTDFYSDNRATANWSETLSVKMHLYSKKEWITMFEDAGFISISTMHITDVISEKQWRRELGTLFITGMAV